ncbi:hypothetical protein ANN_17224 [Periplaneta americana]|uniref:DUF4817 domain-containing protein n=1 Tax=Periplaneta americana TaxID=6978 RepID=A0ABQ8STD1_PERAM|nr:hypothetical protein ANN_17224 [Periplaneta americana]
MAANEDRRAFFVLDFHTSQSVVNVQRNFRRKFGLDPPSGPSIRKWYADSKTRGCICKRKSTGRPSATVAGNSYLDMLQLWLPQLEQDIEGLIFQQDGAPPHYHLDVRNELNKRLPRRWIGRAGREDLECLHWPLRSPDLTPCDFFLWGFIKQQVHQPPLPPIIEDLRVRITEAIALVDGPMLQRVWREIDSNLIVQFRGAQALPRVRLLHMPRRRQRGRLRYTQVQRHIRTHCGREPPSRPIIREWHRKFMEIWEYVAVKGQDSEQRSTSVEDIEHVQGAFVRCAFVALTVIWLKSLH